MRLSSSTPTRPGTGATRRSASSTPESTSTTRVVNVTSTGQRKIVDWVTYTDPFTDGDPTWRQSAGTVNVVGGAFTAFATAYTGVPVDGTYKFARMREDQLGAASEYGIGCGADLNRNGACGDFFVILWQDSNNNVLVDSDNDHSFADESSMTDYKVNFDIGHFGHDNPATPVSESVPFVVQTDPAAHAYVGIGIVSGAHGTHVTGIMAGNSLFGGRMSGAAPGAKVAVVRVCLFTAGCTSHALIEGMIYVIETDHVDVVNMSIGGLPALNDGNTTRAVLYNRLIEDNNVEMFFSAGNDGPGTNTIGDPAVISKAMAVGAYITTEDLAAELRLRRQLPGQPPSVQLERPGRGRRVQAEHRRPWCRDLLDADVAERRAGRRDVHASAGLRDDERHLDGVTTGHRRGRAADQRREAAAPRPSPRGRRQMFWTPAQLRMAMNSSARFLHGYNASDQGNGLINVGRAWSLLKQGLEPVNITSRVEVHTLLSDFLADPGHGPGIYDREGVVTGSALHAHVHVHADFGPNRPVLYHLDWVGNDGTFSTQNNVQLRPNVPTQVNVSVNPRRSGIHSAILQLDNSSNEGIDYETMNTVIAPDVFTAANGFTVTKTGMAGRNHVDRYFFRVPAGDPVLRVDLAGPDGNPGTGQVRFLRFHPWGLGVDSNASTSCYAPPVAGCATGNPYSRTVDGADEGVWEVTVEARRTSDTDWAPYTLTASLYGVSVTPNPDVIPSAQVGVPVPRSYSLQNNFAPFTGQAVGSPLGSARRGVFTIANGETQDYTTTIPAGSTSFRATIGGPSDAAADLDLFVYQCSDATCATRTLRGQSADGDAEESVTIANPAAGTWQVEVDGFEIPAGTTTYNYVDIFANPTLGSVSVTDSNALRPTGASWTVPGSVTAGAVPEAGRVLLGAVNVMTEDGVKVGSNEVVVEHVSP